MWMRILIGLIALPAAVAAQPTAQIERLLAERAPGARIGLVVASEDGRELIAIRPDERFIPGSNTKIFVTAAAFATLVGIDRPDEEGGAAVRLEMRGKGQPDLILEGHGDARLSSAADCAIDCLAALADAVAAKTRVVHDVVGDDSAFPDERWSQGMSWNNIPSRSGTASSALTIDDNELLGTATPGAVGAPPTIALPPYYVIDNRARTVAGGATGIDFDREPNGTVLRIFGTIAADARPETLRLGIDEPARYAAWRLKALLVARGVRVTGTVLVRHRLRMASDDPAVRHGAPAARPPRQDILTRLVPPPLAEDLILTNKVSQNLHAELALRRVGAVAGTGSAADGLAVVRGLLEQAGVPRVAYDFSDGSGMSTYNRVTPRATITFLRWIGTQPWAAAWRATLPRSGEGTLGRRFAGTPLDGRIAAKTGSLNATNALSGYLTAKSGRTLLFASFANDVPEGIAATKAVDAALALIAQAN